jgi:capsular polysaccharide biosynthesis protein
MKKRLFAPPSFEEILCLLQAWRLWLVGALIGGILGAAGYALFPPDYRARATVLVDFNIEETWPQEADREVFYFLEREVRKLEEVAWSDSVMNVVEAESGGIPVSTLRGGKLILSQPEDGGWHFYAEDENPEMAANLAAAWAKAFVEEAQKGVSASLALQNLPETASQEEILALEEKSLGVSPYLQISPTQIKEIPVARKTPIGTYIFFGAVAALVFISFTFLFFVPCYEE